MSVLYAGEISLIAELERSNSVHLLTKNSLASSADLGFPRPDLPGLAHVTSFFTPIR